MSEQLDSLRKRIDEADRELLEALAQRMKVVNEIPFRRKSLVVYPSSTRFGRLNS